MASYKNPVECFAPIEVVERLLEIRTEAGFSNSLFLYHSNELADYLDAYGFDVYSFTNRSEKMDYGKYRAPLVPNGDVLNNSIIGH